MMGLFIVFLLVFPDKQKRRSIYLFRRGLFRAGIKINAATHTYREQASGYCDVEERGIQPIFLNRCKWNSTFKRHIKIKKKKEKELLLPQVLRGSACLRRKCLFMFREAPGC